MLADRQTDKQTRSSQYFASPTGGEVTSMVMVKGKGKVFQYSLPSVGPGADPGAQAVSPQVT